MNSEKSSSKTQIIIAIIGLIGVLSAALIANPCILNGNCGGEVDQSPPEYFRLANGKNSNNKLHFLDAIGNKKLNMTEDSTSPGTQWHLVKDESKNIYQLQNLGDSNARHHFLNAMGNGKVKMTPDKTATGTYWQLNKIKGRKGNFYYLENLGKSKDTLKFLNAIGDGKLNMTTNITSSGTTWQLVGYK